jgi:D-glycero-D-manno-heptose 1,7-bisphosphate phosphatase
MGQRSAVFLDRDGVLNRPVVRDGRPYPPASVADLEIVPEAGGACRRLRHAGFLLVVVTNQPDVARGAVSLGEVNAINRVLVDELDIDDVRVCPHDDSDQCRCRKPAAGLLLDAARFHGIDLASSFMVGDRWRDIEAGRKAGCHTILVDYGWLERQPDAPDVTVKDVAEAAAWICQTIREKETVSP